MKREEILRSKNLLKKNLLAILFFRVSKNIKSKRLLKRVIKKSVVKIELGSGSKKGKNGWITIDLYGADINMDLRRRLPIPNFSVDKFFASHFLEHLNIMELHNILTTCFQQLKIGGLFYIAVPDASLFINAYSEKRNIMKTLTTVHEKSYTDTNSKIDQINYIAYMSGEHKHMFDSESLVNLFLSIGFQECKPRHFFEELDTKEHIDHSLYFVAIK